jgi:hypothetical protein
LCCIRAFGVLFRFDNLVFFHVIGLDARGAIALRQKWSRGQVETRLANMPPCLIGMEACVGLSVSK